LAAGSAGSCSNSWTTNLAPDRWSSTIAGVTSAIVPRRPTGVRRALDGRAWRWKTAGVVLLDPSASAARSPGRPYRLDDRYRRDDGTVFLSGAQALARLPFEQLRLDRSAGLRTAAYVTGYPGSPLAGYDREATAVARLAAEDGLHLVHQPALNEELAATAVMGSQLTVTLDSCRYDGVIGVWYGKSPGLDRASDAIRHAVFAGTSEHGGAVALVGDDPSAKSSTLPSSSDATLAGLHVPVLFPGDVQEAVDLGRHAVALSRASGLWTAIRVVESVADGTGTVELHPDRTVPIVPVVEIDGPDGRVAFRARPTGGLVTPYTLDLERELHVRLEGGPTLRRREPAQRGWPCAAHTTGSVWSLVAAPTARPARRCGCWGWGPTTICAPPASDCCASACRTRSTARSCVSSPRVSPR
jgi:hypothetical protein